MNLDEFSEHLQKIELERTTNTSLQSVSRPIFVLPSKFGFGGPQVTTPDPPFLSTIWICVRSSRLCHSDADCLSSDPPVFAPAAGRTTLPFRYTQQSVHVER